MIKFSHVTEAEDVSRSPRHDSVRPLGLVFFLVGLAVYAALFYASTLPSFGNKKGSGEPWRRVDFLAFLAVPDELWSSWTDYANPHLIDRVPILLTAGGILAFATVIGWLLMVACRADTRLTRLEHFVFATSVGLSAVSLYTLCVGLSGLLRYRTAFWIPAALVLMVASRTWVSRRRHSSTAGSRPDETSAPQNFICGSSIFSTFCLWATVPFVAVIFLGGMLPPIDFDVREYHLQAPKEFYQRGVIQFLPHNVYGNMPLGAEMLSLLAMVLVDDWWTGALVGKTLIAAIAPLGALGLLAAGRRYFSPNTGSVAALVYLSTPWIVLVSTSGLMEGVSALFLLLSFYAFWMWRDDDRAGICATARGRLLLCGFLAGSAVACKYPAAVFVCLPLLAAVTVCARATRSKSVAWFLVAVSAACGPWLVKNAVLSGNPVYPLACELLDGETRTAAKDAQWRRAHSPPNYTLMDAAARLASFGLRSEWLSPLLIPLAAVSLLPRQSRRATLWLWGYVAYVLVTWWLFTHRIERFWVPVLPIVALLAGIGANWLVSWRRVLATLLTAGLVSNLLFVTSGPGGYNRYFANLASLRSSPERVPKWFAFLNHHVPAGKAVLAVGDAAVFDLEVPVYYNTTFDDSWFEQWVRESSPETWRGDLSRRISHVYVHWGEIARYRQPGNYGFTPFVQPEVFDRLVAQGALEPPINYFAAQGVQIYRLRGVHSGMANRRAGAQD